MWNNLKTTILLAAMTGLVLGIGEWWGGQNGLILALVFAAVMNLGSYFFSDKIALASSGAQPISREDGPRIYQIVDRLAAKANIPVPKIYFIPTDSPNAFATGRNPNHAAVAVTRGILDICDDEEIEGVLAHELGHVKNRDILTSAVVATLAGAITLIGRMLWYAEMFGGFGGGGGRGDDRRGGAFSDAGHDDSGAAGGHAHPAWPFRARASMRRMLPARASPAIPKAWPAPSTKLISGPSASPCRLRPPWRTCTFFSHSLSGGMFSSLFSTHPPIRKRIERLIGRDFV